MRQGPLPPQLNLEQTVKIKAGCFCSRPLDSDCGLVQTSEDRGCARIYPYSLNKALRRQIFKNPTHNITTSSTSFRLSLRPSHSGLMLTDQGHLNKFLLCSERTVSENTLRERHLLMRPLPFDFPTGSYPQWILLTGSALHGPELIEPASMSCRLRSKRSTALTTEKHRYVE